MTFLVKITAPNLVANASNHQVCQQLELVFSGLVDPSTIIPVPVNSAGGTNMKLTSSGKGFIANCGQWLFFTAKHTKYTAFHMNTRRTIEVQDSTEEAHYADIQIKRYVDEQNPYGGMNPMSYGMSTYDRQYPMAQSSGMPQRQMLTAPEPACKIEPVSSPAKSSFLSEMESKIAELEKEQELKEKLAKLRSLTDPKPSEQQVVVAPSAGRAMAFELGAFITKEVVAIILTGLWVAHSVAPSAQYNRPSSELARTVDTNAQFFERITLNQQNFMEALFNKQNEFTDTVSNLLKTLTETITSMKAPTQAVSTQYTERRGNEGRRKNYDSRVQTWEQKEYANYEPFYKAEESAKYTIGPTIHRIDPSPVVETVKPIQVSPPTVETSWNWASFALYAVLAVFVWMVIFKIGGEYFQ
jgi:hypothetical protein